MAFHYDIDAKIIPQQVRRGSHVSCEVRLSNVEGRVGFVMVELPSYGLRHRLPLVNGIYTASVDVPGIAPRGNYEIHFYAVSTDRKKGPVAKVRAQIL